MLYHTAQAIRAAIVNGETQCETVLTDHLRHMDAHNPALNAVVIDMRDRALEAARTLDRIKPTDQKAGQLHGVPISIKEAFNLQGFKTTVNYPPLKHHVARRTSPLVQRLEAEGALVVGKTNVPLLLSDSQTFGPLYPTCNNPYDQRCTPGGSTGGGAAAVAAGMSCFELGSDIGGSIRNPAHYCGLFGLKPTQNGHVHDGHVPPLPGRPVGFAMMNCTGPLARTIDDLRLAYEVAYAPDWDHLAYLPTRHPAKPPSHLSEYRVAWYDHIGPFGVNNATRDVMGNVMLSLRKQGAHVEKIQLDPGWSQALYEIWATLFGLMAGQDFNWGMRQLLKLKFKADAKGSALNVYPALKKGLNLDFKAYSETLQRLKEHTTEFNRYFDQFDVIVGPTSAGEAFPHNPKHHSMNLDGRFVHYADYAFTFVTPYNAMGQPVLVIPCQTNPAKLPIGLQCIGPHYAEEQLLAFGAHMEKLGFRFRPPLLK